MAVVKLGAPIKTNLEGALAYIINPQKTDGGRLVEANYGAVWNDAASLAGPMMEDNRNSPQGVRKNSRLAYHIKMSFSPDDPVTAEQAHRLGMEFASRITGDDYRFVVATHTDRHHLHNHIIFCAAGREAPHQKAQLPKSIIDQWRVLADDICIREGLSIIRNEVVQAAARTMEDRPNKPSADKGNDSPGNPYTSTWRPETPETSPSEPPERRYGMSMAELYSAANGAGIKDRIRTLASLMCEAADSFEDWKNTLHNLYGITVTEHGEHLTYTIEKTGFKVRDTKLGTGYDMTSIMACISHSPITQITFNRTLVAKQNENTVTVWLPGTKHQKKIVIPSNRVFEKGSTLRAFLPLDRTQIILDRSNRYAGKTSSYGLHEWFGDPSKKLQPLASDERLPLNRGVSPAQRRYYQAQAKRLDKLNDEAKALNATIRWTRLADGDSGKGLKLLRRKVRDSRSALQASVIAMHDAIARGDANLMVETRDEMERRANICERYESELNSIERTIEIIKNPKPAQTEGRQQPPRRRHRLSR